MRRWPAFLVLLTLCAGRGFAQKSELKKAYTDITNAIHSSLLTHRGADEIQGFFSFNRLNTKQPDGSTAANTVFQAEPAFSHFFFNGVSLGCMASYFRQTTDGRTFQQTAAGPVVKAYIGKKRIRPFLITDYLVLSGDDLDGGVWDFGAGLLFHVSGNMGIAVQGKYGLIFPKDDSVDRPDRLFIR
jgi:hypothetical protein